MKKMVLLAGLAVAAGVVCALQVPEEEQFGQRVWFLQNDRFETGNYRDYFMRSFAGELKRNQAGYSGYVCDIAFADSRPFPVQGGRKYVLRMKVYNQPHEIVNDPKHPPAKNPTFPSSFSFLTDDWKDVKVMRARNRDGSKGEIEGAFLDVPPPVGKWVDCAFPFTAPQGAKMFVFSISYGRGTNWGRYYIADVRLEEAE